MEEPTFVFVNVVFNLWWPLFKCIWIAGADTVLQKLRKVWHELKYGEYGGQIEIYLKIVQIRRTYRNFIKFIQYDICQTRIFIVSGDKIVVFICLARIEVVFIIRNCTFRAVASLETSHQTEHVRNRHYLISCGPFDRRAAASTCTPHETKQSSNPSRID
jgi:hypothetical protein